MKTTDIEIPGIDSYMTIREINQWIDLWRLLKYGRATSVRYFDENGMPNEGEELADEFATIERARYLLLKLRDINGKLRSKGLNYYLNINERESLKNERESVYDELVKLWSISETTTIPDILKNDEAQMILTNAVNNGWLDTNYKWHADKKKRTKQLCAYFVEKLCRELGAIKKRGDNYEEYINWTPFENYFGCKGLKNAKQSWMKFNTKFTPTGYEEIDKLFIRQ